MGVAGQRPAMGQRPLERRRPRFTLTEEADGFELDQQGYGETVVDFRDVDIAVAHPGFGEGPLGGLFTAEIGQAREPQRYARACVPGPRPKFRPDGSSYPMRRPAH